MLHERQSASITCVGRMVVQMNLRNPHSLRGVSSWVRRFGYRSVNWETNLSTYLMRGQPTRRTQPSLLHWCVCSTGLA